MRWYRYLKYGLMEDKDLFILRSQYHSYWWPGDARGQGISNHSSSTDPVLWEYSGISTRSVNLLNSFEKLFLKLLRPLSWQCWPRSMSPYGVTCLQLFSSIYFSWVYRKVTMTYLWTSQQRKPNLVASLWIWQQTMASMIALRWTHLWTRQLWGEAYHWPHWRILGIG